MISLVQRSLQAGGLGIYVLLAMSLQGQPATYPDTTSIGYIVARPVGVWFVKHGAHEEVLLWMSPLYQGDKIALRTLTDDQEAKIVVSSICAKGGFAPGEGPRVLACSGSYKNCPPPLTLPKSLTCAADPFLSSLFRRARIAVFSSPVKLEVTQGYDTGPLHDDIVELKDGYLDLRRVFKDKPAGSYTLTLERLLIDKPSPTMTAILDWLPPGERPAALSIPLGLYAVATPDDTGEKRAWVLVQAAGSDTVRQREELHSASQLMESWGSMVDTTNHDTKLSLIRAYLASFALPPQ